MTTLELRVFTPDGATLRGWLTTPIRAAFSDEFNGPGEGEVEVPLASQDAALLTKDAVVRVFYRSKCVFAWVVEVLEWSLVSGDDQRTLRASGRGLLSWLDDAIIYPDAGFVAWANPDRQFNFASQDGTWTKAVPYKAPVAVPYRAMTGPRQGQPRKWPDDKAAWLWTTDPSKPVPAGAEAWFRSSFTLDKPQSIQFAISADNRYQFYLDGSPFLTQDTTSQDRITWTTFAKKTVKVPAGTHTVAVKVQNEKPLSLEGVQAVAADDAIRASDAGLQTGMEVRVSNIDNKQSGLSEGTYFIVKVDKDKGIQISKSKDGSPVKWEKDTECDVRVVSDNTAGLLFSAYTLNDKNRPDVVVERSAAQGWLVSEEEPRWIAALILWTLIREAQERGVTRLKPLTRSFNDATDSNKVPWTTKADTSLPVGSTVLNAMDFIVELGVDVWIDPVTLALGAAEYRGADKSSTVRLNVGLELVQYATSEEPRVKTAALVRTRDGWAETRSGTVKWGRRETLVQVDRTRSEATGKQIAQQRLRRLGKRQVSANEVVARATDNATPYLTFGVGDIVGLPGPDGTGMARTRVLSIAMETDGDDSTYAMELEVLGVE